MNSNAFSQNLNLKTQITQQISSEYNNSSCLININSISLSSAQNIYLKIYFTSHLKSENLTSILFHNLAYRNKVITYIITYHRKLKFNKLVLFQATTIINRYIDAITPSISQNILAITALILAHKKVNAKKINFKKLMNILKININVETIVQLENDILNALDYDLEWTTSLQIALLIHSELKTDQKTVMFTRYLLQLSLYLEEDYWKCPVLIALCCIQLSCFFLQPQSWNQNYAKSFRISNKNIHDCSSNIFNILLCVKQNDTKVVYQKFLKSRYQKVAQIQFECHSKQNKDQSLEEESTFDQTYSLNASNSVCNCSILREVINE